MASGSTDQLIPEQASRQIIELVLDGAAATPA
jgi:hypothetical protein